jgi:inorganic pyrophosphatase
MRPADLATLPTWSDDGDLHVVIETPRGASVKLAWQPQLGAFLMKRALPLGVTYPHDWGFVPGTRADDGDPLDALVLHDASTYPGIVLPCRPLGLIMLEEDEDGGERQRNDRVIAVPVGIDRAADLRRLSDLAPRLRDELERFFLNTTFFTSKNAAIVGWKDEEETRALVRRTEQAA